MRKNQNSTREKLFRMVSVGVVDEPVNQAYDVISTSALILNLAASILLTFDNIRSANEGLLLAVESGTVLFFAVDYVLRLITANCLYPESNERDSLIRYIFSGAGIIDLLSFLTYYLPVFFPTGLAVFRMFRVVRIFRLFRINTYYDSLNVITEVIASKKQQLLSSVFIILTLMLASSLCMYSLEHEAQPDVFKNAFSGIWWSASTLLTVGYGDIYPVTTLGRIFSIVITFLGVGMVAIPTGIISAGFVEQYSQFKRFGDYGPEKDIRFIHFTLARRDSWSGRTVRSLSLPQGCLIAAIQRGGELIIPGGDVVLTPGDVVTLGAEPAGKEIPVHIREIILKKSHPWTGSPIRDIDISRQAFIVMVKRKGKEMPVRGNLVLQEGDRVFLLSKEKKAGMKAGQMEET
ncbi:MAG: TrkA C-terminal domain-containing protein [Eubacteriales bacterium]|nr:TrkA C-terminal domain-containing protein [Eubacteriales bacterium]